MLNCPYCGLTNRPYNTNCEICDRELQDKETAAEKEKDWNALPTKIREEYEEDYYRARERFEEHKKWLNKNRLTHAILGAVFMLITMNIAFMFQVLEGSVVDILAGAGASLLLNYLRGGSFRGLMIFVLAGILAIGFRFPFINATAFWLAWYLLSALALMFTAGLGYYMGLKLAFAYHERMVIG